MGIKHPDIPSRFAMAVLEELGSALSIREVHRPAQLEVGQVLVRLIRSGLCASQLHEIDGRKGPDGYLPHTLGHEGVAEVVQVGPGVARVFPGDLVILHWRPSSGINAPPAKYQSDLGLVNAGPVTTFSDLSVVSENRLTNLPEGVSIDLAPLFGCSLTTGFGAVVREARVLPGESAVILGFGGVGIAILKAIQLVSAGPLVVFDVDEQKISLALAMGAEYAQCVSADEGGLAEQAIALLGRAPDVVFEVTGQRHLIEQGYAMTADSGRTVLVGVPDASNPALIPTLPLHLGKRLIGSHGGSSKPDEDIPRLASLVASGRLNLDDIPLSIFPLSEINSAIGLMRAGNVGRIVISME